MDFIITDWENNTVSSNSLNGVFLIGQKATCPIHIGWNKPDASEAKPPNRATTRSRKLPVTRSTDFLW